MSLKDVLDLSNARKLSRRGSVEKATGAEASWISVAGTPSGGTMDSSSNTSRSRFIYGQQQRKKGPRVDSFWDKTRDNRIQHVKRGTNAYKHLPYRLPEVVSGAAVCPPVFGVLPSRRNEDLKLIASFVSCRL
mmetsp:Transcript_31943/g.63601  ORF Transcript_31943/g.63601 Transcript_31943/m.63601 type:complete len:133 (+) Transcript_31943:3073-3471(+)